MFLTCPRKYYYAYIEGVKVPEYRLGTILLAGNIVHDFAAKWLQRVMECYSGIDQFDDLLDLYAKKFEVESKLPDYRCDGVVKDDIVDCIREFVNYATSRFLTTEKIKYIEKEIWMNIKHQTLKGYVDLITNSNIYDWKVTKSKPNIDDKYSHKNQLILYCQQLNIRTGINVYLYFKVKNKNARFEIVEKKYSFTEEDFREARKFVWKIGWLMDKQEEAGVYQCNPSSRLCCETYCKFYNMCPKGHIC